jgi:predicted nucleotidyltransferase
MLKHHEDSIKIMISHYREDHEITALFLTGSVATGTERPDSDLDGVAVVSQEYYERKKNGIGAMEACFGKCTYQGGYFDVHFKTRKQLEELAENGSEPLRNMFSAAKVLYCDEPDLPEIVARIPVFQKEEAAEKQKFFYCTLKQFYNYYWKCCKPQGFHRHYVANGMIFNLYRLILLENEILFPSSRKLERTVQCAENKPEMIIEKCHRFMQSLSDEDALELINSYEVWTSYDYPKDFQFIANNFLDPYEWK